MNKIFSSALVAAALTAGSSASAAVVVYSSSANNPAPANLMTNSDISIGDTVAATEILTPGDSAEFTFTALETLRVSQIALSGTGNTVADLQNVEFGFTSATTDFFSFVSGGNSTAFAGDVLPGLQMSAGDSFTIFWEDGISAPVALTASFNTTAIPVPAALPLMLGGIAALGAVSRKKKKS